MSKMSVRVGSLGDYLEVVETEKDIIFRSEESSAGVQISLTKQEAKIISIAIKEMCDD